MAARLSLARRVRASVHEGDGADAFVRRRLHRYHVPHNRGRWRCSRCPEASSQLHSSVDVGAVFLLSVVGISLCSRHVDDGAVACYLRSQTLAFYHTTVVVGAAAARPRKQQHCCLTSENSGSAANILSEDFGPVIHGPRHRSSHRSEAPAPHDSSVDVGPLFLLFSSVGRDRSRP